MSKIIISYRRSDSRDIAGRIRDLLVAHYGKTNSVYMDIDSIPPGHDFREHINKALGKDDVVVAIIGIKWLGPQRGKRLRINDACDPVRVEIETALQRGLKIVPVLVNDADMPSADELPETIKEFAYRNAATVDTGQDFHVHVNRLIRALDELRPASVRPAIPWRSRAWTVAAAAGGVAAIVSLMLLVAPLLRSDPKPRPAPTTTTTDNSDPAAGGVGGPFVAVKTDRPVPAPSPRKYFEVADGTLTYLVYIEATGQAREWVFAEVPEPLAALGARPGDWAFVGRRDNNRYEGVAYHYTGSCNDRRVTYPASGPVINELTVEISGEVPRLGADCKQARGREDQLLSESKMIVAKYKFDK